VSNRRSGGLRARDTDRNAAVAALDNAYADGQLGYEEHSSRVSAARGAKTLHDLHALTSDLQLTVGMPAPDPVHPATGRARPWVLIGVVAAAVAAGALLYVLSRGNDQPAASTSEHTSVSVPTNLPTDVSPIVAPPVVLDTADGLRSFIDQYRDRFGETTSVRVLIYPQDRYASVRRYVDERRTQDFSYRAGFEPSGTPSGSDGAAQVDLAALNVDALVALMSNAPATVAVQDGTVSHVVLEHDGTAPSVSIYVRNEYDESGFLEVNFAGDVLRVYPFRN